MPDLALVVVTQTRGELLPLGSLGKCRVPLLSSSATEPIMQMPYVLPCVERRRASLRQCVEREQLTIFRRTYSTIMPTTMESGRMPQRIGEEITGILRVTPKSPKKRSGNSAQELSFLFE